MSTAEDKIDALEQGNSGGGGSPDNSALEERIEAAENNITLLNEQYESLDTNLGGRVLVNEGDIEVLKNGRDSYRESLEI